MRERILTPKNAGRMAMEANKKRRLVGTSGIFVVLAVFLCAFQVRISHLITERLVNE